MNKGKQVVRGQESIDKIIDYLDEQKDHIREIHFEGTRMATELDRTFTVEMDTKLKSPPIAFDETSGFHYIPGG